MPSKWGDLGSRIPASAITYTNAGTRCVHGEVECLRCGLTAPLPNVSLAGADIENLVRHLDSDVRNTISHFPEQVILAGGYIRSTLAREPVNDVDLFVGTKELAESFLNTYKRVRFGNAPVEHISTPNSLTFRIPNQPPIQLIHRFPFEDPGALINTFDFTIAQAAVWFSGEDDWRGICSPTYYQDLASKRLVYTFARRSDQDVREVLRVLRFSRQGYSISAENLAAVLSLVAVNAFMGTPTKIRWNAGEDLDLGFNALGGLLTDVFLKKIKDISASPTWEELCQVKELETVQPQGHDI